MCVYEDGVCMVLVVYISSCELCDYWEVCHPRWSCVRVSPCESCDYWVIPGGCGLREVHVRQ